jgi:hypothetical protein
MEGCSGYPTSRERETYPGWRKERKSIRGMIEMILRELVVESYSMTL